MNIREREREGLGSDLKGRKVSIRSLNAGTLLNISGQNGRNEREGEGEREQVVWKERLCLYRRIRDGETEMEERGTGRELKRVEGNNVTGRGKEKG